MSHRRYQRILRNRLQRAHIKARRLFHDRFQEKVAPFLRLLSAWVERKGCSVIDAALFFESSSSYQNELDRTLILAAAEILETTQCHAQILRMPPGREESKAERRVGVR